MMLVLATGATLAILFSAHRIVARTWSSTRYDILAPTGAPLLYLFLVLTLPLLFVIATGNGPGSVPAAILSADVTRISFTFVLSLCGSLLLAGLVLSRRASAAHHEISSPSLLDRRTGRGISGVGRLLLVLAIAIRLTLIIRGHSLLTVAYGEGQLTYGLDAFLGVLAEALALPAMILIMMGNARARSRPLTTFDYPLVVLYVSIVLLAFGNRGEIVAPIILYFWFHRLSRKRVRPVLLAIGVLVAAAVFGVLGVVRSNGQQAFSPQWLLERVVWDLSSPVLLTYRVSELVPSAVPHLGGSTYAAGVRGLLPGPISRAIWGPPDETGAFVYRRLIRFDDPNQGWGFAFTTEAYLNFGHLGVATAAVLLAWLLLGTFLVTSQRITIPGALYPLLIAYLPYGFRSDFLAQLKTVSYSLFIIASAILLARALAFYRPFPNSSMGLSSVSQKAATQHWTHRP